MLRILGITLIIVLAGLAVIFHSEIKDFSDNYTAQKQAQEREDLGDYAGALQIYKDKSQENPNNIDLAMHYAALCLKYDKADKAQDAYRALMNKYPQYLPALLAYGQLLGSAPEKRNNVLELYRKALAKQANQPALLLGIGNVFLTAAGNDKENRGELKTWLYDWAIYYYRHALKLSPRLPNAWFNLGIAYQQTKRTEKAATSYCNAIVLNPNTYDARYNLGVTLVDMRAYSQGYLQMDKAINTLRDVGNMQQAQSLAEKVQMVKNRVYNDNDSGGFSSELSNESLSEFLSPDCTLSSGTAEGN